MLVYIFFFFFVGIDGKKIILFWHNCLRKFYIFVFIASLSARLICPRMHYVEAFVQTSPNCFGVTQKYLIKQPTVNFLLGLVTDGSRNAGRSLSRLHFSL